MRLSVSNLALGSSVTNATWRTLYKNGVRGIEVAPTMLAPWDLQEVKLFADYRSSIEDEGLTISSLQAIFFGAPEVALLGDEESFQRMIIHMHKLGIIAECLGAKIAVLGAPKQRRRGNLTEAVAFELGSHRLSKLSEIADMYGFALGLEPIPSAYGGDFLQSWQEVVQIVNHVNMPALRVHLDTGCVFLGGGMIDEAISATCDSLLHFHISEPNLHSFTSPVANHNLAAISLTRAGYSGWLAIEMSGQTPYSDTQILDAVNFVTSTYNIDV